MRHFACRMGPSRERTEFALVTAVENYPDHDFVVVCQDMNESEWAASRLLQLAPRTSRENFHTVWLDWAVRNLTSAHFRSRASLCDFYWDVENPRHECERAFEDGRRRDEMARMATYGDSRIDVLRQRLTDQAQSATTTFSNTSDLMETIIRDSSAAMQVNIVTEGVV